MSEKKKEDVQLGISIDSELHKDLKVKSAKTGIPMKELCEKAIRNEIWGELKK